MHIYGAGIKLSMFIINEFTYVRGGGKFTAAPECVYMLDANPPWVAIYNEQKRSAQQGAYWNILCEMLQRELFIY